SAGCQQLLVSRTLLHQAQTATGFGGGGARDGVGVGIIGGPGEDGMPGSPAAPLRRSRPEHVYLTLAQKYVPSKPSHACVRAVFHGPRGRVAARPWRRPADRSGWRRGDQEPFSQSGKRFLTPSAILT